MRMRRLLFLSAALAFGCVSVADAADVKIKITKKYINFPVSHKSDRKTMEMSVKGGETCRFVIRLAEGEPDYWTFRDVSALKGKTVSALKGKTVTLTYDGSGEALAKVYQDDRIAGGENMYKEKYRPQYHFTTRRGWINDPNGLIYYKGKYHLFYQHNPFEREWENMHWAHAVSTDLVHWREMPLALHPDTLGTIFSGSAVIDYGNTAGWNSKDGTPALVAFYTSAKGIQRQSMAYSLDEGMTFTKYEGNPIIDSHEKWQTNDTRDPKVFWYAPGKHWVMVLNERDGHSIYNSVNLKDWTYQSHITGFWECPELFEVSVDGNGGNKKWVMWGASGTYMIGSFDGKTFTPDGPKLCNLNGSAYAAQVFNNIPANDGRVIKIAWGRISFEGMPFNGCMLLPQEQMLFNTRSGLRLASRPVREVEQLFTKVYSGEDLSMRQANDVMRQFDGDDVLRIRMTMHLSHATDAGLSYRGQRIVNYDMNGNRLNGEFYATDDPGSMMLTADVYMDRSMAEVFVDGGMYSYSMGLDVRSTSKEGYVFWGNNIKIRSLEVYKVKSIWDGYAE
ncbi:2 6-beta-D-fructofuranosidase [Prevotella sp. CAG:487]|nr:2 6-beta-D-fructofuranosidase [Prevotella sp. CAG:487]